MITLDLSGVNWYYVAIAVAAWLLVAWSIWRRPNDSLPEQYLRFQQNNPHVRISYHEWLSLGSQGPGTPVPPGRIGPVIRLTGVFLLFLFVTLVFGLQVIRW